VMAAYPGFASQIARLLGVPRARTGEAALARYGGAPGDPGRGGRAR
jgi:hypothetical protein